MDGAAPVQPAADSNSGDETTGSNDHEDSIIDTSRKTWEILPFGQRALSNELYVYSNTFHLIPSSVGRFGRLKTLKFLANDIEVSPLEAGDLVELETLQVKISVRGLLGIPFEKFKCLKELELCRVPPRSSALSMLGAVGSLKCLTKLSICHFSIRYFFLWRVFMPFSCCRYHLFISFLWFLG